jgi:hypothetical protein
LDPSTTQQKMIMCSHTFKIPPRYNWNIVESGVKHNNPNPNPIVQIYNVWSLT